MSTRAPLSVAFLSPLLEPLPVSEGPGVPGLPILLLLLLLFVVVVVEVEDLTAITYFSHPRRTDLKTALQLLSFPMFAEGQHWAVHFLFPIQRSLAL